MSSITVIRKALQSTIQAYMGTAQMVYDTVPGITELPGVVIEPAKGDFLGAMGRGTDEWYFNVMVFASRADEQNGQNNLDELISGAGPKSIRQAIFLNPTLGLADSTAVVTGMRGYGGTTKDAGMGVVGAILTVCVYTDGRV